MGRIFARWLKGRRYHVLVADPAGVPAGFAKGSLDAAADADVVVVAASLSRTAVVLSEVLARHPRPAADGEVTSSGGSRRGTVDRPVLRFVIAVLGSKSDAWEFDAAECGTRGRLGDGGRQILTPAAAPPERGAEET